ncbi:MAG: hypothetical protein EZS28_030177 [Streblomastix strix]|uniref:Uncharacterized protein n=1 Tax=Streblomastix strix TaxID=222440 RepID=A0A5J4UVF5_9EUKA|nr:MAG: hypothetical protein EZS28_030177 [Streblomastix strix]
MNANQDDSTGTHQFSEQGTQQTHVWHIFEPCNRLARRTTGLSRSGGNVTCSTGSTVITTHGDTSSRQTTPVVTSNERHAHLRFLIASAAVLRAEYTNYLAHFGGQSDRSRY